MPEQNENGSGVGYRILELRIENLEKEMKEVKTELKDQAKLTTKGFNIVNDRVDAIEVIVSRVEIIISNFSTIQKEMKDSFSETQKEMKKTLADTIIDVKKEIEKIAESAGSDSKWRSLIKDIITAVILLGGMIATGKWFG